MKDGYIEVECIICNEKFIRYRAHPYIKKCHIHRSYKGRRKAYASTIDGIHIPKDVIEYLLGVADMCYSGIVFREPCKLQLVTYCRYKDDESSRFFRIGSKYFYSRNELQEFVAS